MGILSSLFGRKINPEPTSSITNSAASFGFGPQFATPEPIVREAFDQITEGMGLPTAQRNALRDAFAYTAKVGDTRAQENVVISHLVGSGWKWPAFDLWSKRFGEQRQWPYMWHRIHDLLDLGPNIPERIEDALAMLKVAEMKAMLGTRNALPKPAPRRRDEAAALIRQQYSEAELLGVARQRAIERYRSPTAEEVEVAKCRLLAHTITMRSYALRDSYDRRRLAEGGFREALDVVAIDSNDPMERAFVVDLFNRGQLSGLPPFFPGDRTCLILRSAVERSQHMPSGKAGLG